MEETTSIIGKLDFSKAKVEVFKKSNITMLKSIIVAIAILIAELFCAGGVMVLIINTTVSLSKYSTAILNICRNASIRDYLGMGVIFVIVVNILMIMVAYWSLMVDGFIKRIKNASRRYKYIIRFRNIITGDYESSDSNIVEFYSSILFSADEIRSRIEKTIRDECGTDNITVHIIEDEL